jgi:hypothetical protein
MPQNKYEVKELASNVKFAILFRIFSSLYTLLTVEHSIATHRQILPVGVPIKQ